MSQGKIVLFTTLTTGSFLIFLGYLRFFLRHRSIQHPDSPTSPEPPPLPASHTSFFTPKGLPQNKFQAWHYHLLLTICFCLITLAYVSINKPPIADEPLSYPQILNSILMQVALFAGSSLAIARISNPQILHELSWQRTQLSRALIPHIPMLFFMLIAAMVIQIGLGYQKWAESIGEGNQQFIIQQLRKPGQNPYIIGLTIFTAVIVAPFCEELFFRGLIYRISRSLLGPILAALASGLIFGAIHGNLASLPMLVLMGILLALLYEWSGSLWTNILFHMTFNGFMSLLIFFAPTPP